MIIVQLTGGLGNQMFQYAFAKRLALKHSTSLKLDLSFFETYEWHEYSLAPFNIEEQIATYHEIKKAKGIPKNFLLKLLHKYNLIPKSGQLLVESSLKYDETLSGKSTTSTYLEGYFQSEKYFEAIADDIKKDFVVKQPAVGHNLDLLNKIDKDNSICLHIRRGNYANIPEVTKAHGLIALEYYYKAIDYISQRVTEPVFYIFSDDIDWAKENLKISNAHIFIDNNDDKTDFEDIRMLSRCKHNIIANSTFSWWGAWLNSNPEKIIIAPKKWFNDTSRNSDDIIPTNWIQL